MGKTVGKWPPRVRAGGPLGGGRPLRSRSRYFDTFGGRSTSIAAAAATLPVVEDETLLDNTGEVGTLLRSARKSVLASVSWAGEIRGIGLYWGVDLNPISDAPRGDLSAFIVNAIRERNVLITATGSAGQCSRSDHPRYSLPVRRPFRRGAQVEPQCVGQVRASRRTGASTLWRCDTNR